MAEDFDPMAFLRANRARSAAVAADCEPICYSATTGETAQNCGFPSDKGAKSTPVAKEAGIAAPKECGLPWEAGLARFLAMPRPEGRSRSRWRQLLDDCVRFNRDWGQAAHSLGWTTCDAYGSPSNPYLSAVDQLGLVPLLDGRTIAAITDRSATILNDRGPPNTFYLYPWRRPGVPLWVAYSTETGP